MEAMQCGLSWNLVLQKREILRQCFAGFDYNQVAQFTDADVQRILSTEGMIRSEKDTRGDWQYESLPSDPAGIRLFRQIHLELYR